MRCLSASDFTESRHAPIELRSGEIHVWFSAAASAGMARVAGDWLRRRLAGYVGAAPEQIGLARGEHGKPLMPDRPDLQFNLAHSGGALLFAIARSQPLGIDIETDARRRPALELARRFFCAAEADALARLDAARRQAAFLQLWSCKEAVVKALGRGIGFGLDRLAFDLDECGVPQRLNVIDSSAGAAAEWQIVRLEPACGYRGALAWRGPSLRLRAFAVVDL